MTTTVPFDADGRRKRELRELHNLPGGQLARPGVVREDEVPDGYVPGSRFDSLLDGQWWRVEHHTRTEAVRYRQRCHRRAKLLGLRFESGTTRAGERWAVFLRATPLPEQLRGLEALPDSE